MSIVIKLFLVCLTGLFVTIIMGCSSGSDSDAADIAGGRCEYKDFQGSATITAVTEPDAGEDNCKNAVKIIFTFTPNDASAPDQYRFSQWPDNEQKFTVGSGKNPPKDWAESVGLIIGSTHKCVRSEIISGTCTPVIYSFPDIDLTGWETWCF